MHATCMRNCLTTRNQVESRLTTAGDVKQLIGDLRSPILESKLGWSPQTRPETGVHREVWSPILLLSFWKLPSWRQTRLEPSGHRKVRCSIQLVSFGCQTGAGRRTCLESSVILVD